LSSNNYKYYQTDPILTSSYRFLDSRHKSSIVFLSFLMRGLS